MGDKLTPRQRDNHNKQMFGIGEAFEMLQNDRDALLIKLAAIETERDEAAALARELLDIAFWVQPRRDDKPGCYCNLCETFYSGLLSTMTDAHADKCIIERIRVWLAKQEDKP
jgi:hypothetical protein